MTKARDLADYIATGVSDTELDILDGLTTTTAELNYNDTGAAVGTVVASKTVTVDANKDASSFRNLTMAGDLSIAGDVVTVSNANLDLAPNGTGTVVVRGNSNSGAIVFNCESNSHGQKVFGQPHSASVTNTLMLPAGANSTLVSLVSTDTLTNKTLTSPKVNEDVAVTSTATELNLLDGVTATTAELNILDGVTATAAEINLIDGGTSRGTTAVADGDGFLTNDGGTMRMTSVDTLATYMQNKIIGGTSIVTTGALDSGSITSGFGTINTGSSAITTTGAITGGSFVIGSADINENDLESIDGITAGTIAASKAAVVDANKDVTGFRNITLTGELDAGSLDVSGDADIDGTTNLDVVDIDGAVDMASTLQVDGAITSSAGATITTADNNAQLTLISTDADASVGPALDLHRNSGSPADDDAIGRITFSGENDADEKTSLITFTGLNSDVTNGSEDGRLQLYIHKDGSTINRMDFEPTVTAFNNDAANVDFRVKGDSDANLLYADASTDRVGIGKNNPSELLDVDGTLNTTNLKIGGAQGSDGQVLTSTGSGVAFEDAAGGGKHSLIASTVLSSAASSMTVTGITGDFEAYVFRLFGISQGDTLALRFNFTDDSGNLDTASKYTSLIYKVSSSVSVTHTSNDAAYAGGVNIADGFNIGGVSTQQGGKVIEGRLYAPHTYDSGRPTGSMFQVNDVEPQHHFFSYKQQDIDFGGICITAVPNSGSHGFDTGSYLQLWSVGKG